MVIYMGQFTFVATVVSTERYSQNLVQLLFYVKSVRNMKSNRKSIIAEEVAVAILVYLNVTSSKKF